MQKSLVLDESQFMGDQDVVSPTAYRINQHLYYDMDAGFYMYDIGVDSGVLPVNINNCIF